LILLNIRIGGTFQNEYEKYKLQIWNFFRENEVEMQISNFVFQEKKMRPSRFLDID
jgi:hypothetical protein